MYSEEVLEHFTNPRNVGELQDADGVGVAGNIQCGDMMRISINVGGDGVIEDIKFKTLGCAAAIATSSKTTELAKGKTVEGALAITKKEIADSLGGLPPIKMHCSMLASDALKEAVYDYLDKTGKQVSEELQRDHERISRERESLQDTHY